jgi:hypothetical protein
MKRALAAIAIAGLVSTGILTAPARADSTTDLRVLPRWSYVGGEGQPLVTNEAGTGLIAAYKTRVIPWISCPGDDCLPARPARMEVLNNGTWMTWSSGTLSELADPSRSLTSNRTATIQVRPVLPAHEGLPEVIGPPFSMAFLPGTTVRVTGTAYIPGTRANDYEAQFRPGRGSITLQLTPAAVGRKILLKDVGVPGYPVVRELTTDARGRATFRGDLSGVTILDITVVPTKKLAGWNIGLMRPA